MHRALTLILTVQPFGPAAAIRDAKRTDTRARRLTTVLDDLRG